MNTTELRQELEQVLERKSKLQEELERVTEEMSKRDKKAPAGELGEEAGRLILEIDQLGRRRNQILKMLGQEPDININLDTIADSVEGRVRLHAAVNTAKEKAREFFGQ